MKQNYFELFQLPVSFQIDPADLAARHRAVIARVHPDQFANKSAVEQRMALQWATFANEAFDTLKSPVNRAQYLLQLHAPELTEQEARVPLPPAFLMQQMEWREALDEARTLEAVEALADDVSAAERRMLLQLGTLIDERQDWPAAAGQVRALMFVARFAADVDRRLDALGQ